MILVTLDRGPLKFMKIIDFSKNDVRFMHIQKISKLIF